MMISSKFVHCAGVLCMLILVGCANVEPLPSGLINTKQNTNTTFQKILDGTKVTGSILIYDRDKSEMHSNDFERASRGFLPASTYKVPHVMIALESGIVTSDTTMLPWDGVPRNMPIWNRPMPLSDAVKFSCVPCFQDIARQIGSDRMKKGVEQLEFGDMEINAESVDQFWLRGDSKISQMEQVDFWSRFYDGHLSISPRTDSLTKKMTLLRDWDQYKLWGKTGWAASSDRNIGWFVGMLEAKGKMYFFATNVEPNADFDMQLFPPVRRQVTMNAFRSLGVIPK